MRAVILSVLLGLGLVARAVEPGADASKSYRLETEGTTRTLRAGGTGKLVVSVVPLDGTKVHPAAPLKVALSSTAGVKLSREALARADAVDPKSSGPRFEVPFTAVAAGAQEARARFDFYLCTDTWCVRQVRDVSVSIAVE